MNMNLIKRISTYAFLLLLFKNCTINTNNDASSEDIKAAMRNAMEFLMKPDSLRSTEEKELFLQLEAVLYENCTVKNGKFEIILSKKEWKKKGVPEMYYDILKHEIVDINHYLDTVSAPLKELFVESWQESVDEYLTRKSQQ